MSVQDKRLERITELARKIDQSAVVDIGEVHAVVTCIEETGHVSRMVSIYAWPRATFALEAALLALAGEPSAAEVELKRLRAGIEELAAEWQYSHVYKGPVLCVTPFECAQQARALLEKP